jgi:hypothetical protein
MAEDRDFFAIGPGNVAFSTRNGEKGRIQRQAFIALDIGSRNAEHESHTEVARRGTAAPQPR